MGLARRVFLRRQVISPAELNRGYCWQYVSPTSRYLQSSIIDDPSVWLCALSRRSSRRLPYSRLSIHLEPLLASVQRSKFKAQTTGRDIALHAGFLLLPEPSNAEQLGLNPERRIPMGNGGQRKPTVHVRRHLQVHTARAQAVESGRRCAVRSSGYYRVLLIIVVSTERGSAASSESTHHMRTAQQPTVEGA